MFCCRESLVPSIKLANMIKLFKIIGYIHFAIIILDIFLFKTFLFLLFLMQFFFIQFSIYSKGYSYFIMVILIILLYIYKIFESSVQDFLVGINDGSKAMSFCFKVFLVVFEIFCIFLTFQLYKQSKHEYRIIVGLAPDDRVYILPNDNNNGNNNENNNNNDYNGEANNENNNQDEIQPFQEHENADANGGNNNQ